MKKSRGEIDKTVWIPLAIVAVAAVFLFKPGASDPAFAEAAETQYLKNVIAPAAYKAVVPGMTLEEVQRVIGHPGAQASLTNAGGFKAAAYSWQNSDGSNAQMIFQGEYYQQESALVLSTKAQFGLD